MAKEMISLIVTVYNEEETIEHLLDSIVHQTRIPDEVIIVDGGSSDRTVEKIKLKINEFIKKKIDIKVFIKRGNRAVGRNEAIRKAKGTIILVSDAGCILDKKWIETITKPFQNSSVDVVGGYYKGLAKTVFQKCLVPYVLVMPERVDENNFLPATRSMAFTKNIWEQVGGFPEKYSYNEDYVFAKSLKKAGAKTIFEKKAIVYWIPRKNIFEAFWMFYKFSFGDVQAGIIRPKVVLIFARYIIFISIIIFSFILSSSFFLLTGTLIFLYFFWAVYKNYTYIKDWRAVFILPSLQITSDLAVMIGSFVGFFNRK